MNFERNSNNFLYKMRKRRLEGEDESQNRQKQYKNEANSFVELIKSKFFDDSVKMPDILTWPAEERQRYIQNVPNPFGWPKEYYDIYMKERNITDPKGFEGTTKINDISIFKKLMDQRTMKTRIQQIMNVNCIKGVPDDVIDLEDIYFSPGFGSLLYDNLGILYFSDYDDYFNNEVVNLPEYNEELERRLEGVEDLEQRGNIYKEVNNEFDKVGTTLYADYLKNIPNKYRIILNFIKVILAEYAQYVCIAGGFALSMYIYEHYGYSIGFKDIDMFIYGCDEQTANEIIKKLQIVSSYEKEYMYLVSEKFSDNYENTLLYNDNVIFAYFLPLLTDSSKKQRLTIQIIRRLYTCPAQIILGFDVDSCCILTTLDGDIYTTERGFYAIQNGYNVLNFDRMSPSYEYRLSKYRERGFGIWIPFAKYFKDNASFDWFKLDSSKLSSVIIKKLINNYNNFRKTHSLKTKYGKDEDIVNDYEDYNIQLYKGDYLSFKTLEPGQQIINTFHRLVLNDILEWYPKRPNDVFDFINFNHISKTIIEVHPVDVKIYISAMNVIRKLKEGKRQNGDGRGPGIQGYAQELVKFIESQYPRSIITGGLVNSCISGFINTDLVLYSQDIHTLEQITRLKYDIINFRVNRHLRQYIKHNKILQYLGMSEVPFTTFGKIVYSVERRVVENRNLTDEDNYNFFKNTIIKKELWFNGELDQDHHDRTYISFVFSEEFDLFLNSAIFNENFMNAVYKCTKDEPYFLISLFGPPEGYDRHGLSNDIHRIIDEYKQGIKTVWTEKIDDMIDKLSKKYSNTKDLSFEYRLEGLIERDINTEILLNKMSNDIYMRAKVLVHNSNLWLKKPEYNHSLNPEHYVGGNILGFMLDRSVDLEVKEFYNEEEMTDSVFYTNGKFFSNEYEYELIKAGFTHEQISDGTVKILDYPAWQQFFPN